MSVRRSGRKLGGPLYREDAPDLVVGTSAENGLPIVIIRGGHIYRRAEGISFASLAMLRELRADLGKVIEDWPS